MTKSINTTQMIIGTVVLAFAFIAVAIMGTPVASAASYAYVDTTGEVRSVVANDWMQALATAVNIHIHSGVFILNTAADFTVVGKDVQGAK